MINITLIDEKEVIHIDCKECNKPFDTSFNNNNTALEVDHGEFYLHKSCALLFMQRLAHYAK